MDTLEKLYKIYIDEGLLTSRTTLDQFKEADVDIQKKLYDLGKEQGVFETTNLETFQQAWQGVKKKDSSVFQKSLTPKDTKVTESTLEEPPSSLEFLEDSISKRGLSKEYIDAGLYQIPKKFYEDVGLNYEDFILAKEQEEEIRLYNKREEGMSFFGKWYDRFLREGTDEQQRIFDITESSKNYLKSNEDLIYQAEKQYSNSLLEAIKKDENIKAEDKDKLFLNRGGDYAHLSTELIKIDGKNSSFEDLQRLAYDKQFINDLQNGKRSVSIDNPTQDKSLENLNKLIIRQIESGGQWFDILESFAAGGLDLLVAGPLEILEGAALTTTPYGRMIYNITGGKMANAVKDQADKIRERTRVYKEEGILGSLLEGNWSDALFQLANGVAESAPLIIGMSLTTEKLAAKVGKKAARRITLGGVGSSAGGLKSLELKKLRAKGEIDISDTQLYTNVALTGGAEAFWELTTLDLLNSARRLARKNLIDPKQASEIIVDGFLKSAHKEGRSEFATELSNSMTDYITGASDDFSGLSVKLFDSYLLGSVSGGGIHTTGYLSSFLNSKEYKDFDKNIIVKFTLEDGSKSEMTRSEALRFIKTPGVAQSIRDGKITPDGASITDEGVKIIDDVVFGFYAPDAIQSREIVREKESKLNDVVNKIEKLSESKQNITNQDIVELSEALNDMNQKVDESRYNETTTTRELRTRVDELLSKENIIIDNPVQSQDASGANITETTDAVEIKNKKQYDSVKKQLDEGKRKPIIVESQSKEGIIIKGVSTQKSEIKQSKFKNVSEARNALKDFDSKEKNKEKAEQVNDNLYLDNNKLFIRTKKDNLDNIPQDVLDKNNYHIVSSDRSGITEQERESRMEQLKAMLDEMNVKYYTVQDVNNKFSKQSLLVNGLTDSQASNVGNSFQQESIFSSKSGLIYNDGRVRSIEGKTVKGPDARKKESLTIVNVNGKKTSIHVPLTNEVNITYGKTFNADNIHKLDESNPNYDKDLLDGLSDRRKRALGFAIKLLNSVGNLNITVLKNSSAMQAQLEGLGYEQDAVQKSRESSFFRAQDKTMYINLETIKGNTLLSQVIHPLVDFIKSNDVKLYNRIKQEVSQSNLKRRVLKNGVREKGSYLQWAQSTYPELDSEGQIEHAFAEMMGDAAYGHFLNANRKGTLDKLREVISSMLSKLGFVPQRSEVESVDLNELSLSGIRSNIAGALVNGRKIKIGGVNFEVGDVRPGKDVVIDSSKKRKLKKKQEQPSLMDIKRQLPDDSEINVYKTGLAAIVWDIPYNVIKADYALGDFFQKAPITGNKTGVKKIDARLSELIKKPFGTHTNKEINELMVLSKGDLAVELYRADLNIKKLNSLNEKNKFTDKELNDLLSDVNKIKALNDSEIKMTLFDVRRHIDRLSQILIDEDMVTGQTTFAIDKNKGLYIARSYKQFEVKNWEQKDPDIIKKLEDFLYKEIKRDNPNKTETELKKDVELAFNKLKEKGDFKKGIENIQSLNNLKRVTSIFKQRQIIPEELREFWGEIDNPIFNYTNTVSKIARTISAERFYRDFMEIGQGKFISDTESLETPNKIVGKEFGSLQNKFVDNEMFNVLNKYQDNVSYGKAMETYFRLLVLNKKAKTVWNPGTHAINIVGNLSFALNNGHISFKDFTYANKVVLNNLRSSNNKELSNYYEELIRLGVVNTSASLSEIQTITKEINKSGYNLADFIENRTLNKSVKKYLKKGAKFFDKADSKLTKLYQAEDDVYKIYGYEIEKARYIEAGFSVEEAKRIAARNVRGTYPNYDQIPRIVRYLGRNPFVASFVAFQAESIRNTKNSIMLGRKELGSNNPKLRSIGAKRLAGSLANFTLMNSIQLAAGKFFFTSLGNLFGAAFSGLGFEAGEDLEGKKLRMLLPHWDSSGNLLVTGRGQLESKFSDEQVGTDRYVDYFNFSAVSGVGYIKDIFRLAFTDINTEPGKDEFLDATVRIATEIFRPFLSVEMTTAFVTELLFNPIYQNKVFNLDDNTLTIVMKMIKHIGKNVQPGASRSLLRIAESYGVEFDMEEYELNFDGDSDLVPEFEILALFGLRINRVNLNKSIFFRAKDINNRLQARLRKDKSYINLSTDQKNSMLRERITEYDGNENFDKRTNDYINQFADIINSGLLNGIEGDDIRKILAKAGLNNELIDIVKLRGNSRYFADKENVRND